MKQYEITFVTKEEPKEKAAKEMIESSGGKIVSASGLGEKQFVYPIKKETKGFYTTAVFEIEPEKLSELNKKLGLSEEILRHLIIIAKAAKTEMPSLKPKKVKEEIPAPKEIAAPEEEKKLEAPKPATRGSSLTVNARVEHADSGKIAKPLKKVEKPKAESLDETRDKPTKKVPTKVEEIEKETISEEDRLKELDKKLDELLKE
jgi:small subunit ribosomal protein S6